MNELELKKKTLPVISTANRLIIQSPGDYAYGGEFLKSIKEAQKKVTEYFEPIKTKAYQVWKEICGKENQMLDPLKEAETTVKRKMLVYQQEEERKRQAEQARLQAIADEKARRERDRLAKEAEKLKTPELKEQRMAEAAAIEAPIINIQPAAPKIAGISTRKTWKAELTSKGEFIKAATTNPMLMAFIEVDMAKMNRIASATKGEVVYPGIRFYEESNMASGSN